jgi:hypothetical protein
VLCCAGQDRGGTADRDRARDLRQEPPEWQERARRDAGGPVELSTAQKAMLEREKMQGGGSEVRRTGLTTAQQAMLDREQNQAAGGGDSEEKARHASHSQDEASDADGEVAGADAGTFLRFLKASGTRFAMQN